MDSDELASMYAQILNGVAKKDSHYVTDDESSRLWDKISAEVADLKKKNPKAEFAIPHEI